MGDAAAARALLLQRFPELKPSAEAKSFEIPETELEGEAAFLDLRGLGQEPAAALLGALHRQASLHAVEGQYLHYWMSETLRGWFDAWNRPGSDAALDSLRDLVGSAITMGINLRGRTDLEFRSAYACFWRDPRFTPDGADADSHPRVLLGALCAVSSFAAADLARALRLLIEGPPASDAAAMLLVEMAATYYGEERTAKVLAFEQQEERGTP